MKKKYEEKNIKLMYMLNCSSSAAVELKAFELSVQNVQTIVSLWATFWKEILACKSILMQTYFWKKKNEKNVRYEIKVGDTIEIIREKREREGELEKKEKE